MTLQDKAEFLDRDQVKRAVHALNEYIAEQKKTNLVAAMDEFESIQLQFTFKKIQSGELTIKIPLPHSLVHTTSDVCLFVKDLNRKDRDYQPTVKHYKKLLAKNGITSISEVIPLKQIKLEYQPYEAKRNLSNMYDVFLADATVMRLLPEILGKSFYGRKRFPVQVNLNAVDLKKAITKALNLTFCILSGKGPSGLVKVAHSGLGIDESVENIMRTAEALCESLPGGANNIRNMHIRTSDSPALPIYMSADTDEVVLPPRKKRKVIETEPEEVSTVTGAKVQVTSRGKVRIISDDPQKAKKKTKGKKVPQAKSTKSPQKQTKKSKKVTKKSDTIEEDTQETTIEVTDAMSEKEREHLEMRRNRENDADLFSDTTADSELSDTEEMVTSVEPVKSAAKTKKVLNTGKKSKASKSKGTNAKSKKTKKAR